MPIHTATSSQSVHAALAMARAGDTVLIPSGAFVDLRSPINVTTSNITLRIDGTLAASTPPREGWPVLPPLPTYGRDRDGAKSHRHHPILLTHRAEHVRIIGDGNLDGGGSWWWTRRHALAAGRPHLIEVYSCTHIELSGLRLSNSPFWTVHIFNSSHVQARYLTIRVSPRTAPQRAWTYEGMAPLYAPNTDGINPDSSSNVLIEHNDISCGDDHVAIKSGMNQVARDPLHSYRTSNITVRRNIFRLGMGVSIGSETAGGVRHVRVLDNVFTGGSWGIALHVKTAAQRGNSIEDVSFHHNMVHNMTALMRLSTFGKSVMPTSHAPTSVKGLAWEHNVFAGKGSRRLRSKFLCPSHAHCADVRVANNTLPPGAVWRCAAVRLEVGAGETRPRGCG